MCTLMLGRDLVGSNTVLIAANRDEDPSRPSDPPQVLNQRPRVVGGKDRLAGGTWLGVREGPAVVAMLNRRDRSGGPAPRSEERRSRGLLALEVAMVDLDFPSRLQSNDQQRQALARAAEASGPPDRRGLWYAALCRALASIWENRYAPFTLVFASPESCWIITVDSDTEPRCQAVTAGWHVLTHADLDDPAEPRTARLIQELAGFRPRSAEAAEERLGELLGLHDGGAGKPAVCLHQGRMVTVSSALVRLAPGEVRYRHAEGRSCEHGFADFTDLLGREAAREGA